MNLRDLSRRFRADVDLRRWLVAGIYGGLAGGLGTAWLLWGWPGLVRWNLCFLVKIPIVAVALVAFAAFGITFILTGETIIRGIRQMRLPASVAMYEPPEPIPEMSLMPHPGCGLALVAPVALIGGGLSLPWFWFAPQQVPVGWLLLSMAVGLPVGLVLARREVLGLHEEPHMPGRRRR